MNFIASIRKYIPLILGILLTVIGIGLMLVPFIPVGYVFIFAGIFFLAPYIPFLRRFLNYLKKKDKRGILNKVEKKIRDISLRPSGKKTSSDKT